MLIAHVWDEIDCEWGTFELDLPADTRDPQAINRAVGLEVSGDSDGDGWEVKSHATAGPILTIETRSGRNHLAIIVVNGEEQE